MVKKPWNLNSVYAFVFEVIVNQLQHGMVTWVVAAVERSPIEWGFPSLSLPGSSSCIGGLPAGRGAWQPWRQRQAALAAAVVEAEASSGDGGLPPGLQSAPVKLT